MAATIQLPDNLAGCLVDLAREENISIDILVGRLVSEHLERRTRAKVEKKDVRFPLLSSEEVPVIVPQTGAEIDELFAREDFRP